MPTDATLLEEARALGLDVEEERADLAQLRADLSVLRILEPAVQRIAVDGLNDGRPLVVGDVSGIEPKVDLSDRAAALDRYARLSWFFHHFMADLAIFGEWGEDWPDFRDRSEAAEAKRVEVNWLGDLPTGVDIDTQGADPLGEMNRLYEALFPESSAVEEPEYEATECHAQIMAARLLLRLADNSDLLRRRAHGYLYHAARGLSDVTESMGDLQEWFEKRRREKGGDDDA